MAPTIETETESTSLSPEDLSTMSSLRTLQDLTTSAIQNVTMIIFQNLTSSTMITTTKAPILSPGGLLDIQNFGKDNDLTTYNEYNSITDSNSTDSDGSPKKYSVVPGSSEVMIIIAIVFVLLYIAAKYIGCTLSHWPFCSKCFKHRQGDNYQTGGASTNSNHHHHFGHRYRQEYSRRDVHYAVYSRPTTAYPRPMTAYSGSAGLSAGFQDPGFSYNSSFDMNDMDHCKVVVSGDEVDTEQPPTYDSIVPSYTTQTRYTYSSTR